VGPIRRATSQDLGGRTVRPYGPYRTVRTETAHRQSQRGRRHLVHGHHQPDREILRLQGDLADADVRRSKAIGILAQPALALQLLWDFQNEQHPAAGQPQEPDQPIDNEASPPHDQPSNTPTDDVFRQPIPESADRGLIIEPPAVDVRKLRPRVMLHLHLSEETLRLAGLLGGGVARLEEVGPLALGQVSRFLSDTGCDVTLQPVIDTRDTPPVDSYEIPRRIREAMFLRMPASCFPYAASTGHLDLDHTKAFVPKARGGPPGQTGSHNLGPMIRFEHRIKTHGRWQVRQPEPGVWICRSPNSNYYLVTNTGTQQRGNGLFARRVWTAAGERRRESISTG